jgi:tRNA/tmRNA/rRNA uracil-C5-methylase (TrmA/RlmC/RlmD family)
MAYSPGVVTIRAIAAGGEGVGRLPNGCTVFVHRTAPGDVVEVAITHRHRRWARARLVELRRPGEGRRGPPCPLYEDCGGCTLQHLTEEAQRRAKADIVAQALVRLGGVELPASPQVIPAPRPWRYRNRMTFVVRRHGSDVVAGLHALGEPDRLVDVDDRCLLPEPAVSQGWARLRAAWAARPDLLPPAGEEAHLTVRATADGQRLLTVAGGGSGWDVRLLAAASGPWAGVWQRRGDGRLHRLLGAPAADEMAGEPVRVAGDSFLQVNREAAALLYQEVERQIGAVVGLQVVEAYAGVAILSRRLARAGARVVALEGHPQAAAEARRAGGFQVVTGAVERHLAAALPAAAVIVNPPRGGLSRAVIATLLAHPPRRLVYVSCDPATLGRDVHLLAARFQLAEVRCVDLFPQTAHVETVATLTAR